MREKLLKVRFPVRFSGLSRDFPRMTQLVKTRTTGRFLKKDYKHSITRFYIGFRF